MGSNVSCRESLRCTWAHYTCDVNFSVTWFIPDNIKRPSVAGFLIVMLSWAVFLTTHTCCGSTQQDNFSFYCLCMLLTLYLFNLYSLTIFPSHANPAPICLCLSIMLVDWSVHSHCCFLLYDTVIIVDNLASWCQVWMRPMVIVHLCSLQFFCTISFYLLLSIDLSLEYMLLDFVLSLLFFFKSKISMWFNYYLQKSVLRIRQYLCIYMGHKANHTED